MTWGDCVYVVVYQIETTLEFNSVQNILWAWIKEKKMSSLISNYLLAFISSTWNVPMHCNVWDSIAYLKNAELWGTTPLFTISIVSLNFIFIFSSNRYSLKELGLPNSVSILKIRPSIFKEIFRRFLAIFLNFVRNQNVLGVSFLTFLAHFSMSKKTQDVFGGYSSIFSTLFNSIKKNQDI
jgi:hypothetical protein